MRAEHLFKLLSTFGMFIVIMHILIQIWAILALGHTWLYTFLLILFKN
jgi:hypothetical protein